MISAYVMPHPPAAIEEVGYNDLDAMKSTLDAYKKASKMIADDAPETIVVISPHAPMYADGFYIADGTEGYGDLSRFGAPEASVNIEYDTELRDEVCNLCEMEGIPYGLDDRDNRHMDHGTIVPLLFVLKEYKNFRLLRISPTYLDSSVLLKMGHIIERAAAHVDRKITIIASADLSHRLKEDGPYGYCEDGPIFDGKITSAMKTFDIPAICKIMDDHDFLDRAGQCGTPSITIMAGAIADYKVEPDFLSYEGPFGIGYAVCAYKCADECVELARKSLEKFIRSGVFYEYDATRFPSWMIGEKAGVFVCIKKNGELRGCIGTFLPTMACIADEIVRLAVCAGTEDPRFSPVRAEELDELEYTVDILSAPEPARIEDLDAKRYGVIVSKRYNNGTHKRGLLLPDLEGVDTVEYQLAIALSKGGIDPTDDFAIERFTVERHR